MDIVKIIVTQAFDLVKNMTLGSILLDCLPIFN